MELRPIEGIRAVAAVGVKQWAGDVAAAIGANAMERMVDDSYSGGKRQERGLEEDAEPEDGEDSSDVSVTAGKVDVLA